VLLPAASFRKNYGEVPKNLNQIADQQLSLNNKNSIAR
jgi:hypothetical protein